MTAAMGSVGSTSQGQTPLFDQMLLDPRLVVPERLMPTADDSMWMTTDDGIDWVSPSLPPCSLLATLAYPISTTEVLRQHDIP